MDHITHIGHVSTNVAMVFDEVILDQEWRSFEIWSRLRLFVWVWSKPMHATWTKGMSFKDPQKLNHIKLDLSWI